jgi:hypothetical protein
MVSQPRWPAIAALGSLEKKTNKNLLRSCFPLSFLFSENYNKTGILSTLGMRVSACFEAHTSHMSAQLHSG